MIRLFKKRRFIHGTYIEIKVSDEKNWDLIQGILQLILEQKLFSLGPSSVGRGGYFAFHTKEDARIIKRYVNKWTREKKEETKKRRRF